MTGIPDESAEVDTLTLSKEAFEAVGTSIQNAAGGVDYYLPEYVVVAITENLIASTWLRQRLTADRDALAAKVARVEAVADHPKPSHDPFVLIADIRAALTEGTEG